VPKVFVENDGRPETAHFHCFLNRFFNADSSQFFSLNSVAISLRTFPRFFFTKRFNLASLRADIFLGRPERRAFSKLFKSD
jgi:hypothetical protein